MLGVLLLDANRAWSLSDIAKHHGTTPSTLQRELATLVDAQIILRYEVGGRVLYRANSSCIGFPELQGLFVKAFAFGDQMREALKAFPVRSAFLYGQAIWGASYEPIEMVVIGNADPAALEVALRPLEITLGRSISVALLSEVAFAQRLADGDYFLQAATHAACLTVIGEDFAAAA